MSIFFLTPIEGAKDVEILNRVAAWYPTEHLGVNLVGVAYFLKP